MARHLTGLQRLDAWVNQLTGLGTLMSRTRAGSFIMDAWLTDDELASLYHQDAIASRIVDELPKHAFRRGVQLLGPGASVIQKELERLQVLQRLTEGHSWGRALGGAIGVIGTVDGSQGDLEQPMDARTVREVVFLDVYDKRDVQRVTGHPDLFRIRKHLVTRTSEIIVHKSRTIRFHGIPTGDFEKSQLDGWDASVLQRVYHRLRAFNEANDAVNHLMQEASVSVFTMRGLLSLITQPEGREELSTRAWFMSQTRSVARTIFLDTDTGEKFNRDSVNFSGLGDVLDRNAKALASSADMPMTILFKQSPAGMNATGESDVRGWYDSIEAYQRDVCLPQVQGLVNALSMCRGVEPPKASFPSLWQESPLEKADRTLKVAQRDKLYYDMGMESAHILAARFRQEGYSDETPPLPPPSSMLPDDKANGSNGELLTPTDRAVIMTVNQGLADIGLPPLPGPDGLLTVAEYKAKNASVLAAGAAAEAGEKSPKDPNAQPPPAQGTPGPQNGSTGPGAT